MKFCEGCQFKGAEVSVRNIHVPGIGIMNSSRIPKCLHPQLLLLLERKNRAFKGDKYYYESTLDGSSAPMHTENVGLDIEDSCIGRQGLIEIDESDNL